MRKQSSGLRHWRKANGTTERACCFWFIRRKRTEGRNKGLPGLGWRRREWDGTVRFRRHDSGVQGPGKGEAKSPPMLHGMATDRCAVGSDRPTNPVPILEPGTLVSATPRFSSSLPSLRAWHESDKSQGVWGAASPNVPSGTLPPDERYFSCGSDANRSPRRA
jgi:hypothetical protein